MTLVQTDLEAFARLVESLRSLRQPRVDHGHTHGLKVGDVPCHNRHAMN